MSLVFGTFMTFFTFLLFDNITKRSLWALLVLFELLLLVQACTSPKKFLAGLLMYMHVEVFSASKSVGSAAICTFHVESELCVDSCTDFLCEVFPYDNNLRALIEDASLCTEIVYKYINLMQGEGILSFMFGDKLQDRDWVCTAGTNLLKGAGFDMMRTEALNELLLDWWTGCKDVCWGDVVKF